MVGISPTYRASSPGDTPPKSHVEQLFRDHNDALLRFLRGRLHNEADAREVAQEAYVRLLQLDKPDHSFLRAYLFKIAANAASDVLRRRATRNVADEAELAWQGNPPTQEIGLAARQQLAIVLDALDELPASCRNAFLLNRHHERTTSEIATELGVSDRMVRLYLVRALEHVQKALDRHDGSVRRS